MKVGTYFCYQLCHPSRLFTKVLKVIKWEVVNSQSTKECLSLSMLPRWSKYGKVMLVISVGMWGAYYVYTYIHFWTNRCEMYWKKNSTINSQQNAFFTNDLQGPSKIHLIELENNESIMNHSSCFLTAKKHLDTYPLFSYQN